MKCLCCDEVFNNQYFLKDHYVNSHSVDENNYFFRKVFAGDRFFASRKSFRCDHYCLNRREEKDHNFLVNYQMGGRQPIEDKPITKTYLDGKLQRFCITSSEHGDRYDFYDSQEIVSEFLTVFENVFVRRADLRRVRFKCSFTIINRQLSPRPGLLKSLIAGSGRQMSMMEFISMSMFSQIWLKIFSRE